MVAEMHELWEILVPALDLNGKEIDPTVHQQWDEKVRSITKGLTVLKSAKGSWTSPNGETQIETVIPVRIACSRDQIEQIADFTSEYYRQNAIMYYKISNECFIKHY